MKVLKVMPIGAALFALGLGLFSIAPSPARADDEDSGTKPEKNRIRIVQEDRESDQDNNGNRVSDSGYLGVQVQRLTAALRRAKGIPESTEGTLVNNVEDQSPADDGGIKRGDIILEVNHEPTPNPSDLVQVVSGLEPGKRVSVTIWRDGVTRTVNLKVGSRPEGIDLAPPRPPRPPRMPDMGGPGGMPGTPDDGPRMQISRRNRGDLESQIKDLQDQLSRLRDEDIARLEREVKELRAQVEQGRRGRDRDERDRNNNDRNQGNNDSD